MTKQYFIRLFINHNDKELSLLLKRGKEGAFSEIYERYWEKLYRYVFNRTNSADVAFEITQDVFVSLWQRRQEVSFQSSLSAYLFASVRYGLIRHIKNSRLREDYFRDFSFFISTQRDNSIEEKLNLHLLEEAVEKSVKDLPERCREIFRMSRYQNMSIKEISEKLNISHKTVENQLTIALKHLRKSLRELMMFLIVIHFIILARLFLDKSLVISSDNSFQKNLEQHSEDRLQNRALSTHSQRDSGSKAVNMSRADISSGVRVSL